MKNLISILTNLTKTKFWGEVTIIFKDGVPRVVKKLEQTKLDE